MKEINFLSIGLVLIFLGVFVIFFGTLFTALSNKNQTSEKSNAKFSFVGLVGPIPFRFGNDRNWLIFSIVLTVIISVLAVLFFKHYIP